MNVDVVQLLIYSLPPTPLKEIKVDMATYYSNVPLSTSSVFLQ